MTDSLVVGLTFVVYLLFVLWIGVVAYQRTRNSADYFLGGRSLPPFVAALSAGASDMSGWLLIGLPGYAYAAGMEAIWIAIGLCTGVALNWAFVARRLRNLSAALDNALTIPAYLQRRFDDPTPWLRSVAAIFTLLFFLFYVSAAFIGGGKLFNTVFDVPYEMAVIIGAVAVVSYTLFGGFLAVSWTDVLQGLLMSLALALVPIMVFSDLGSVEAVQHTLTAKNPELLNPFTDSKGEAIGAIALLSLLGWGLGYFGQPHILARFKAIRSADEIPQAGLIALGWTLLVFICALAVGLTGAAYLDPALSDSEQVFMRLVDALFHPVIAGILLAAILAAIMSTADSQLLVCSSALAEDLFQHLHGRAATEQQSLAWGRWAVLALSIVATLVALDADSKVLDAVAYAWGGLGAAFGPTIILSLYWSRMTRHGALAGIIVGGVTVIAWKQLSGGWFDLYELVPGFSLSLLAILLVSLAGPAPTKVSLDRIKTYC